ncbi:MAG: hypothetical protein Q8Q56_04045 [Alphaproteobacteria bacterium]|nr:hypothetical protein [Alphaproteobacteria bacterium]
MSFVKTILIGLCFISSNVGASLSSVMQVPERKIASYFSQVAARTFEVPGVAQKMMSSHYERLRVRSPGGGWVSPILQNIREELLPVDLNQKHFQKLLDEMVVAAEQNLYLHNVLEQLDQKLLTEDTDKLKEQLDEIGPDLLTYAMVLENITKAMAKDPSVLALVHLEFQGHEKELAKMSIPHAVKYYSVKAAIKKALKAHEVKKVPGDFSSMLLPMNIAEAAVLDLFYGKFGNSKAAWSLIKHGPGDYVDPLTGAAPACFNQEETAIAINMPFSEDWANLYASWNLGFVSSLSAFPYHAAKLLIPQVNAYHGAPGLYMYNRVCALYVHAHYVAMRQYEEPEFAETSYENPQIAKVFSDVNRTNASEYEAKFEVKETVMET